MNKKKVLVIMNPKAGRQQANRVLTEILETFSRAGYVPTVLLTTLPKSAIDLTIQNAAGHDMAVAIGGDGTLREVVSSLIAAEIDLPVGYIPAGSTNDFSRALNLSLNPVKAAADIVNGHEESIDLMSLNDEVYTYVASFGAFTKASYETPQSAKNALGHSAYIAAALKGLSDIRPFHLRLEHDSTVYEEDFIFGSFSNATSIGGFLKMNENDVDLKDGKFEVLLVKNTKNIFDLVEMAAGISNMDYSNDNLVFFSADKVTISADPNMDWTLDGEYCKGQQDVTISILPKRLRIILPS